MKSVKYIFAMLLTLVLLSFYNTKVFSATEYMGILPTLHWSSNEGFTSIYNDGYRILNIKTDFEIYDIKLTNNGNSLYFKYRLANDESSLNGRHSDESTVIADITLEDEDGNIYHSVSDYSGGFYINMKSMPKIIKVKASWKYTFTIYDGDGGWEYHQTVNGGDSIVKEFNIEEWKKTTQAVIKNSFIAPDGTIHQFVPGVSDSTAYSTAKFYVYSSDGKSYMGSYEAFPEKEKDIGLMSFKDSKDYKINALIQFLDGKYYLSISKVTYSDVYQIVWRHSFCVLTWNDTLKQFVFSCKTDMYNNTSFTTHGRNGFEYSLGNYQYSFWNWKFDSNYFFASSRGVFGRNILETCYLGYDGVYKVDPWKNGAVYYSSGNGAWVYLCSSIFSIPDKYLFDGGWYDKVSGGVYEVKPNGYWNYYDAGNPLIVDFPVVNGRKYYKSLTDTYIPANTTPSLTINSPISKVYNSNDLLKLDISVSDKEGDTLTCKYFIDSELQPRDSKIISNTKTTQTVSFSVQQTLDFSEGEHNITFVVTDESGESDKKTVSFTIDKTSPTMGEVKVSNEQYSITLSGSATDSTAGLDAAPYRYTLGGVQSQWTADSSYTFASLTPNTQYSAIFEARDKVGNISSMEQKVYTKAQVPAFSVNSSTENSLGIAFSDVNPANTEYQIILNDMYVNQSGNLSSTPAWITLAGKTLSVSGLSQNTEYQIKTRARNGDKAETEFSSEKTAYTLAAPPSDLVLTPAQTSMNISWKSVAGAVSYNIEADNVVIKDIKTTSYTHTGLTPETSHNYRISTTTLAGMGSWSGLMTKTTCPYPPATPVNFTAASISQTYITLSWDESIKASEYVIEENGTEIGTYTGNSITCNGLMPDTEYKYRIKAKNAGGESAWSDYLTVVTWPDIPEVPANISTKKTNVSVNVLWNQSLRAESYEIEADGVIISTGTSTQYLHEGLNALSNHTYRVRAVNRGGFSEWSQPINVITNPDKPTVPTNIMATSDKYSISLTWYLVPYAESYDVEIDGSSIKSVQDLSIRNIGLEAGSTHTYRVRAVNVTGVSGWSTPVTVSTLLENEKTAVSVTNLVAVVTNSYITLSWDDVDKDATYSVEADGVIHDVGTERVFNHTDLAASEYHSYRVKTKTVTGQEYWCAVLSLSTMPNPPDAPTGLQAAPYDNQIELKWVKSDNAAYDIEVDGQPVDIGENNTYTHQNLNPGTEHTYRVRAKNATGVTAWSTAITKSTTLPEYIVACTKGKTFDFSILASNVQDFSGCSFVVTFNENDLDIEDLCGFTPEENLQSGTIDGTKLNITREAGKVIITVNDNVIPGTSWSGELNNILFKSKIDGETKIGVVLQN